MIEKVISRYIHTNEVFCGLGREDLYQKGPATLCEAAVTYDGTSAQFSTYATAVIRNHLFSHCKSANTCQRNLPAVFLDDCGADDGRPRPTRSRPYLTGWMS